MGCFESVIEEEKISVKKDEKFIRKLDSEPLKEFQRYRNKNYVELDS